MLTRKKIAMRELKELQRFLKGEVLNENGVQVLKIHHSIGEGKVQCICFDDGLIAMEFDILIRENKTIHLNDEKQSMAYFLYCLQGNCLHQFKEDAIITKLEELQTAVVSNDSDLQSRLLIRKDERLILNLIRIDTEKYMKKIKSDYEGFDAKTISLLDSFKANQGYFHLGKINLEIGELIKMLEKAKYVDDLSTLMQFEGICHLILAKQIRQFKFEMEFGKTSASTLLKKELKEISEISDFIRESPELQHSIATLCTKSGLSASKLQQGFRFLNNMTVGEFIRETRLKMAEELLRTSEMNVSEVVYSIGFTSRSYFCKIFKAKYRCNPKQYKQNLVSTVVKEKA
ncbi:helix-turn-helix transcriptional regulator [Maribacter sp. 2307UL18-2]|uniref:helix-turn-helix transcriptional regulator n=1 Tax=Maribacter sp. 2307UL18-2 TaxID=3386274 RepID=UPI0039BCDCA4